MKRKRKTKLKHRRSPCPIASLLDFFGDKWTLVIVRDMLTGKKRYQEFQESPEGIPTNILADRLKKLEAAGAVTKRTYSNHPGRFEYELTARGFDLLPVLQEMSRWGVNHVDQAWDPPDWFWTATPESMMRERAI